MRRGTWCGARQCRKQQLTSLCETIEARLMLSHMKMYMPSVMVLDHPTQPGSRGCERPSQRHGGHRATTIFTATSHTLCRATHGHKEVGVQRPPATPTWPFCQAITLLHVPLHNLFTSPNTTANQHRHLHPPKPAHTPSFMAHTLANPSNKPIREQRAALLTKPTRT